MKIMTALLVLGILIKALIATPVASLPTYTEVTFEKRQAEQMPHELGYMSRKMHYLKTGESIASEINHKKQQNFWGEGVSARVQFPSHLAMWEKARRMGKARRL